MNKLREKKYMNQKLKPNKIPEEKMHKRHFLNSSKNRIKQKNKKQKNETPKIKPTIKE